jgi:hypothetical protein
MVTYFNFVGGNSGPVFRKAVVLSSAVLQQRMLFGKLTSSVYDDCFILEVTSDIAEIAPRALVLFLLLNTLEINNRRLRIECTEIWLR